MDLTLHCLLALSLVAEQPATPAAAPAPTANVEVIVSAKAPPPPPDPVELRRKSGRTYLVAGLSTFGTTYLLTSLYGTSEIDRARRTSTDGYGNATGIDHRGVRHGRALMVPVIGPLVAMRFAPTATARWLELLSGMTQITGLVLTGVGAARLRRNRPSRHVMLDASVSRQGAVLGVVGRF